MKTKVLGLATAVAVFVHVSARAAEGDSPATRPAAAAADAEKSDSVADQAKLKTEKADEEGPGKPAKEEEAKPKEPDKEQGEDATYGHGMQFGLRGGFLIGEKMYFRYDKSPLCRAFDTSKPSEQLKTCGFTAPPAAEVALSFAPFDSVEPYVFARFGLSGESKTNTNALQLYGIGARVYTMADSRLKVFVEPAVAWEVEGGSGNPQWNPSKLDPKYTLKPEYKKDLIVHVGIGPQYDFAKAFGLFMNAGVDVGVLRAISANLHVNIGAQLRFP
ncbi:MAG TPA: hypothetical protein VHE30_15360 [Polyangiaceae bacterium]|nr:hypothetical protein [Polyangiaceae bacterium]